MSDFCCCRNSTDTRGPVKAHFCIFGFSNNWRVFILKPSNCISSAMDFLERVVRNLGANIFGKPIPSRSLPISHWEQGKGQFSSLSQKLIFEVWFSAFCHFKPTPWGPQISNLRFQKQFGAIWQRFEVSTIGKRSIFDFRTQNFWKMVIFISVCFKPI